jgi:hypothetical protein
MIMEFIFTMSITGVISGVVGYLSFDKLLYDSIRTASPEKQIVYIKVLLCVFLFGTSHIALELAFGSSGGWGVLFALIIAIFTSFSVPGPIVIIFLSALFITGQSRDGLFAVINGAATPIIGLSAGFIVAIVASDSEPSVLQNILDLNPEAQGLINTFKTIVGGAISAIIAGMTKLVLSRIL